MNGPSFGADLQPAAGGSTAGLAPRATRTETRALQEQGALPREPSVRVELSAQADALMQRERARAESDARSAAGAAAVAAVGLPRPAASAGDATAANGSAQAVGGVTGQGQETDAAGNVQKGQKPETPEALAKYLATGQKPGPDDAKATQDMPKNWTEKPKTEDKKPPEPPQEPISKKLLEFLQTLWRAGGNAIDVAQNGNQVLNPAKEADSPLTYSDPSAKKTTGL